MTAITRARATTWSFTITGMGSLVGRTALYWTLKRRLTDGDAAALVKIEEAIGLQVIDAATAGTPGNGSITVDDAVAGDITVALAAVENAKLLAMANLNWDVKMVTVGAVTQMDADRFNITSVVTEAVT